jgi:hypothetical protein
MRLTASTSVLWPFANEMACPRRARFYPDSGLNEETRTRPVEACWRFAAVFHATSYPPETREQTRTNVNDLDREMLILLEFGGRLLRS